MIIWYIFVSCLYVHEEYSLSIFDIEIKYKVDIKSWHTNEILAGRQRTTIIKSNNDPDILISTSIRETKEFGEYVSSLYIPKTRYNEETTHLIHYNIGNKIIFLELFINRSRNFVQAYITPPLPLNVYIYTVNDFISELRRNHRSNREIIKRILEGDYILLRQIVRLMYQKKDNSEMEKILQNIVSFYKVLYLIMPDNLSYMGIDLILENIINTSVSHVKLSLINNIINIFYKFKYAEYELKSVVLLQSIQNVPVNTVCNIRVLRQNIVGKVIDVYMWNEAGKYIKEFEVLLVDDIFMEISVKEATLINSRKIRLKIVTDHRIYISNWIIK